MDFKFEKLGQAANQNNNKAAHELVTEMMNHSKDLNVALYVNREKKLAFYIAAKGTEPFSLQVTPDQVSAIRDYMAGAKENLGKFNPDNIPEVEETSEQVREELFRELVKVGDRVEVAPLFKTMEKYIKAKVKYQRGCFEFNLNRTEELTNFIKEQGIAI